MPNSLNAVNQTMTSTVVLKLLYLSKEITIDLEQKARGRLRILERCEILHLYLERLSAKGTAYDSLILMKLVLHSEQLGLQTIFKVDPHSAASWARRSLQFALSFSARISGERCDR